MRAKDVEVGEVHMMRLTRQQDRYTRAPVADTVDSRWQVPTNEEQEVASRHTCIVLAKDVRIPFSSETGIAVAHALFHPRYRNKDATWTYAVVHPRRLIQKYKDWLKDVTPIVARARKATREKEREQRALKKKSVTERKKLDKGYAKRVAAQEKARKEAAAKEVRLRTILHNYGINDSDGWRGVMSKTRHSADNGDVLTTYVRHLDLEDVLRLTGGREEPPARKAARKKSA